MKSTHLARSAFTLVEILALISSVSLFCIMPSVRARAESSTIAVRENRMVVEHEGFRFRFVDATGKTLAPMHAQTGLRLDGQPVVTTEAVTDRPSVFMVATAKGVKAELNVEASDGLVSITVVPQKEGKCEVNLSLGGMPVAYGLGDAGGRNSTLNLVGSAANQFKLVQDGGGKRWLSSFVIFPPNRVAGVVFDGVEKTVGLGPEGYAMTVSADGPVKFHYLLGELPTIYQTYRSLLTANGYPHVKPKFGLFELGWESWAALGYQTRADTILKSVKHFQDNGYPVRWAVSGSGFWGKGGTTTSFGKFGEKFPDPAAFKKALHQRNVKWMIGLRTNFVLPGGPHIPKSKKRDHNLKGNFFNGNPLAAVGLEKDYFLKDDSGSPLVKTSVYFPIVPCYMLDGENPDAVDWYADLYKRWGADGIKEDTMMNLGAPAVDTFNQPIARLASEGALVMARCGSFSSSGTLLRINDTHVRDMVKRTPINYQQYAASGAPNVYSDTVGFRKMKHYSEQVVRHAWLMALTAGLSVGEYPSSWSSEHQRIFKKPFEFHYRFGPYLHDAAMKSYQTGYPVTLTPLGIAYPNDENTAEPAHYQWMAGESLLCAPLLKNHQSGKMDIYLPQGTWFDFDTGKKFQGPKLLESFSMPVEKTPCFVGGKGILVTRESDTAPLKAHIFPVDKLPESFAFHHPDGESVSTLKIRQAKKNGVWNTVTRIPISFESSTESRTISFTLHPGQSYDVELATEAASK